MLILLCKQPELSRRTNLVLYSRPARDFAVEARRSLVRARHGSRGGAEGGLPDVQHLFRGVQRTETTALPAHLLPAVSVQVHRWQSGGDRRRVVPLPLLQKCHPAHTGGRGQFTVQMNKVHGSDE